MDTNTRGQKPTEEQKDNIPPRGWGDSEHDTRPHSKIKPHSCPPEYDPKWRHYRREG